jgi:hypothetical protein
MQARETTSAATQERNFVFRIGTDQTVVLFVTTPRHITFVITKEKEFASKIGTVQIARNFATQLRILITVRMMVELSVWLTGMVKCVLYIARKTQQLTDARITARKRVHAIGMEMIAPSFVTQAQ